MHLFSLPPSSLFPKNNIISSFWLVKPKEGKNTPLTLPLLLALHLLLPLPPSFLALPPPTAIHLHYP